MPELDAERLAVLVHEVRSPVAALSAIAETMEAPDVDGQTATDLVRLVLSACRVIERLVGDLTVSSVRAERSDLAPLIEDAVATARLRGLVIEAAIDGDALPVEGDATRLRQGLDNLLANALTHAGGTGVRVAATADGSKVRIVVADHGPGIPDSERDRIFEPGVRLDESKPGSGLGLAVTRAIVEAHGGRLTVAATDGGGATFVVELPSARDP